MINLKAILLKNCNLSYDEEGNECYYWIDLEDALKEVWNTAVDECKKAVKTRTVSTAITTEYEEIDEDSIEQVKQMI